LHRPQHADEPARRVLQFDARALQQEHEGGRGPVEDRHLFGRDVDVQVVHAQAGAGGHQVFDGVDLGTAIGDGRSQAGVGDGLGGHRNVHRLRQVDAAEHDAGVGLGRAQGQLHPVSAVEAHADGLGWCAFSIIDASSPGANSSRS